MASKKEDTSFAAQLAQLRNYRHRLAVYYDLVSYIDDNLSSTDTRKPTTTLLAPDCDVPTVPQEVVEEVRAEIMEDAMVIEEQIRTMLEEK